MVSENQIEKSTKRQKNRKHIESVLLFLLNFFLTLPIFIIIYKNADDYQWPYQLDKILLFVVLLALVQFVFQYLRWVLYVIVLLYIVYLSYGSISNGYGYETLYEDYNSLIYSMTDNPHPEDLIISKLLPFPNRKKMIQAIEFKNPKVRSFAMMAINKHFKRTAGFSDQRMLIQCFAVFKEINTRWNYVNDPKEDDYIATASESLEFLSGDCDDHSVLMAAAIRAVGGTPRLIHTKGHIYPELLIGDRLQMDKIQFLIKNELFAKESKGKTLFYHIDEYDRIWLNLDYTARFPGGPFLSEEILGALILE